MTCYTFTPWAPSTRFVKSLFFSYIFIFSYFSLTYFYHHFCYVIWYSYVSTVSLFPSICSLFWVKIEQLEMERVQMQEIKLVREEEQLAVVAAITRPAVGEYQQWLWLRTGHQLLINRPRVLRAETSTSSRLVSLMTFLNLKKKIQILNVNDSIRWRSEREGRAKSNVQLLK